MLFAALACGSVCQAFGADNETGLRDRIRIFAALRGTVLKEFHVDHALVGDAVKAWNAAVARDSSSLSTLPVRITARASQLNTWAKIGATNIRANEALDIITCQTGTRSEVKDAEIIIDAGNDAAGTWETRLLSVPSDFLLFEPADSRAGRTGTRVAFARHGRIEGPHLLGYSPPPTEGLMGATVDSDHGVMVVCGISETLDKVTQVIETVSRTSTVPDRKRIVVATRDQPLSAEENAEEQKAAHWSDVLRAVVIPNLSIESLPIDKAIDATIRAASLPEDLRFEVRIDKELIFPADTPIKPSPINLKLEVSGLGEALRHVCELAGAKVVCRDYGVQVLPTPARSEKLITRFYRVPLKWLEDFMVNQKSEPSKNTRPPRGEYLLQVFKDQGILFSEGTAISYDSESGELMIRNTSANLSLCDLFIDSVANLQH